MIAARHREWHKAVDDLLQEVDQALKAKQPQLQSPKDPLARNDAESRNIPKQGEKEKPKWDFRMVKARKNTLNIKHSNV